MLRGDKSIRSEGILQSTLLRFSFLKMGRPNLMYTMRRRFICGTYYTASRSCDSSSQVILIPCRSSVRVKSLKWELRAPWNQYLMGFIGSFLDSGIAVKRDSGLKIPRNVQSQQMCEQDRPHTCDHASQPPNSTAEYIPAPWWSSILKSGACWLWRRVPDPSRPWSCCCPLLLLMIMTIFGKRPSLLSVDYLNVK